MNEQSDQIVLLLASGVGESAILAICQQKLGLASSDAAKIIKEARERITLAANYNRAHEIGTAYTRLNDIYSRSIKDKDAKTALAAQKELTRLLKLADGALTRIDNTLEETHSSDIAVYGSSDSALLAVRKHLAPLGLCDANATTAEMARMAVGKIVNG